MGEFFARIWRLLKTVLISLPVLIVIFIIQNIFGDNDSFIFSTLCVGFSVSLAIAVLNWFTCDLLNVEFLDNVIGKIIKIAFYCVQLLVAILIQVSFVSTGISSDYTLFNGNEFNDVLILATVLTPFASLFLGYKASLDEDFTAEQHWLTVPYSIGAGVVLGIAFSIIFSILPFLQGQIGWLLPVLSVGALVVIMIICKSMPFIEFDYYSYRPSRRTYSGGSSYSGSRKSVADKTAEKDWWNKYR